MKERIITPCALLTYFSLVFLSNQTLFCITSIFTNIFVPICTSSTANLSCFDNVQFCVERLRIARSLYYICTCNVYYVTEITTHAFTHFVYNLVYGIDRWSLDDFWRIVCFFLIKLKFLCETKRNQTKATLTEENMKHMKQTKLSRKWAYGAV